MKTFVVAFVVAFIATLAYMGLFLRFTFRIRRHPRDLWRSLAVRSHSAFSFLQPICCSYSDLKSACPRARCLASERRPDGTCRASVCVDCLCCCSRVWRVAFRATIRRRLVAYRRKMREARCKAAPRARHKVRLEWQRRPGRQIPGGFWPAVGERSRTWARDGGRTFRARRV